MSFSSEVKRELIQIRETSKNHRRLLLKGLLYGARQEEGASVLIKVNGQAVPLIKRLADGFELNFTEDGLYLNEKAYSLLGDLDKCVNGGDRENGLFLRGVFLSCGTVSDPGREYHLELNIHGVSGGKKLDGLFGLITESGIAVKKSVRKNCAEQAFLYIKESELIADFLTYIGAVRHSMEVMNAKILKEVRNNVNRTVNCEAANIGKTARAAGSQISDIEFIYEKKGADFLSPELGQVAELRLNNIDMSLKEIGDACEPKLSRSGVFHRLEKISEIAEKLRND